MSKSISLVAALFCCLTPLFSQQQVSINSAPAPEGYGLEVEVVSENVGILAGALGVVDLTGYSTSRVYITTVNEDDFLSSVSGDATNPTTVNTTTDFYHAALGAATPNGINSLLFPVYPDLAYDSWVTIGLEGVPNALAGEAGISTVQSADNPWQTNFDPGGGLAGGNIAIDDGIGGAWYALNGDAYHITSTSPNGEGATRCMKLALKNAGINSNEVQYINAHGTSTGADAIESQSIKSTFGHHAYNLSISSTKSMTGHLLGAAGGVEAIYTLLAISRGILPPTINYNTPEKFP